MQTVAGPDTTSPRPAYCRVCRGVLPFVELPRRHPLARARFECGRCGTAHHRDDPGARQRRAALRHLIYAGLAGMGSAAIGAGLSAIGADHPLVGARDIVMAWALAAIGLGCVARSAWLGLCSADFGRLTPLEREVLDRKLCPGMIRSDVVDELARRGWTIAKIRTALASLKPAA